MVFHFGRGGGEIGFRKASSGVRSRVNLGFLSLEVVIVYLLQRDTTPMDTFHYTSPNRHV